MKSLRDYAPAVALVAAVVAAWEALVRVNDTPNWLLPGPSRIVAALWETRGQLITHAMPTITESVLGFLVAVVTGIVIGGVVTRFALFRRAVYPLLIALQTVPPMALAPLLVVWFGYGLLPKVLLVILVVFYPVAVSTVGGLGAVDLKMVNLLRTMGATNLQIYLKVRIPAAMPSIFSGMKVGATYTVISAIVGEWMGASKGLGIYLLRASNSFLTDRVFAGIFTIAVLSVALFGIVDLSQRLVMPWYYRQQRSREEIVR
ncbi:MAG: ABC transporter permease [Firmicutes bacterium]|nr:ABC transporter permease [Bacillota bacterium]